METNEHTMELITHSLRVTNSATAMVARHGWPGNSALLNGGSMGPKSELQQCPELDDAHEQLMTGLKAETTRAAKSVVTKLGPLGRGGPGFRLAYKSGMALPLNLADSVG